MRLEVPYYSQFVDIQDPFWMLRACGVASFAMVAKYHGVHVPSLVDLCNEAKDRGGYDMSNGWVHEYLITKAQELGLTAYRREGLTDIKEILQSLDNGDPVIVSVEKRVLEQTRFHLLVVVGYDVDTLLYHEPESTNKEKGRYRICSKQIFLEYFRGKALFISK
jgi:uncharacterized protein YvpB